MHWAMSAVARLGGARNPDSVSRMGEPLPHLRVHACTRPLPQASPATPPPSDAAI